MDAALNVQQEFISIKDKLASYLYRLTANKHDTEDLLQDTFLRVTDSSDSFKGNSSFKTWVFTIATNLARDNYRVKTRWAVDVQDLCKKTAQTSKEAENRIVQAFQDQTVKNFEIAEHINYCFTCIAKNLTLEKQIAIILKEFYQFKRNEIADILKVSEGVVKHLLHEGRNELQEKYHNRCAMINKEGVCYQCAELNDYLQGRKDADQKIKAYGFSTSNSPDTNLDIRFNLINKINPLVGDAAHLEDTIMQILHESMK
jgi:RNA polymerase sigma-70 factor, ECF subfamily